MGTIQEELKNYTLNSIAGYESEKEEAIKIINFFKNFEKLREMGVTIPRGLILSGEPGVGKTLMAKVIASESNVPLYELNCTRDDMDEDYLKKIQEIYKEARKHSPSIVFIDEINEIVSSEEFVTDYSRGSLKTLLQEMDGLRTGDNVLTIATTNNYRILPQQLVRSGRMDKHIDFELPNLASREAILKLYMKDNKLLDNINIKNIARRASGFSCADLKTLINETLLEFINSGSKEVKDKDFYNIIPLISIKGIRKKNSGKPIDNVIYHELGHFICEYVLNGNVSTISAEQIGNARGHIMPFMRKDRESESYNSCMNKAVTLVGGFAADQIFTGQHYTGACNDIEKFSILMDQMAFCGFFGSDYIFGEKRVVSDSAYESIIGGTSKSELLKAKIFDECVEKASNIINDNKELLLFLFDELKVRIKLEPEEVEELLDKFKERNNKVEEA